MWRAERPSCSTAEVATACVKGIRNVGLRESIKSALPALTANGATYRGYAERGALHELPEQHFKVPNVSNDQMEWLYDRRLVASTPGRIIYDRLIAAAPFGLCSYCLYGVAKTLDHVLPKGNHSALSIEPWNLVPVCGACNHALGASESSESSAARLHAYYLPDLGRWLYGRVERSTPVVVRFDVSPDAGLDPDLSSRIRGQFESLGLDDLYSKVAARELSLLSYRLPSTFSDPLEVSEYLRELADDRLAQDVNDHHGVMYEALSRDEWYCATSLSPV